MKQPPWVRHWPPKRDPKCGICGEHNVRKLRYYVVGFRCDDHRPGGAQ